MWMTNGSSTSASRCGNVRDSGEGWLEIGFPSSKTSGTLYMWVLSWLMR